MKRWVLGIWERALRADEDRWNVVGAVFAAVMLLSCCGGGGLFAKTVVPPGLFDDWVYNIPLVAVVVLVLALIIGTAAGNVHQNQLRDESEQHKTEDDQ